MEYWDGLTLLAGVYLLSLASPGPNFVIVTSTSMSVSRRAGLAAGLGLALASLTWAVLTMAGLGFLLAHFHWLHTAIQVVGALYLIWLGARMIRGAAKPLQAGTAAAVPWQSALPRAYGVSMTNPKSIAFFGSIFALAMPAHAPLWLYFAIAAICFAMSVTWYCGLALFFSNRRVANVFGRFKKWIERAMGTALILLGGKLLWSR